MPDDFKAIMDMDARVKVFLICIGAADQAQRLRDGLPTGRAFIALSTAEIPKILKRIFLTSVLRAAY